MPEYPTIRRAREILKAKYGKWYVNTVWGHVIYKPISRGKWKLPYGMTTLDQFIRWHEKRFDMEQRRTDHPLVLEIYCSVTLKRTLTKTEIAFITAELATELMEEFFETVAEIMEWGYDYETADVKLPLEAVKRYSKNGEDFIEKDLKRKLSCVEARLG
jgi:hypothetical protein